LNDLVAQGKKVQLRWKRMEDARDDYDWRADDELARLDATVALRLSFREYLHILEDEIRYPSPNVRRYAIETLDGVHIGNCMSYDIDVVGGEAEVGIMVGNRDYWSQGYGSEAMTLLIAECFKIVPLTRLYLHTLEWNERARKAFGKCGFREVKQVQRGGKSFIYMELLRSEWMIGRE
tara:strand:+ start:254 stop:787 length:534 start_codon:yes stop_codon:yes gene_type:complete